MADDRRDLRRVRMPVSSTTGRLNTGMAFVGDAVNRQENTVA